MKRVKVNLNLSEKRNPSVYYWGENYWNLLTRLIVKIFRPRATMLVPLLSYLKVTPNQVTVTSAVINFGMAVFCFGHGTYLWNLAGLFFLILHYYFDFVDGSLARTTNQMSKLGRWLDTLCDYLGSALILASLCYGVYKNTANYFWMIIAVLIVFAKFALSIAHLFYGNSIYRKKEFREKFKNDKKMTLIDWLIKEFVLYESFFFFFIYTLTYSLFFAIVFNLVPIFLVIIAFFYNLRWFVLLLIYAKILKESKNEPRVISLLRVHVDGINIDEE